MNGQVISEETILALERQIDLCKENIADLTRTFAKQANGLNELIKNIKSVYATSSSAEYIKGLLSSEIDTKSLSNEVLSCQNIKYAHSKKEMPDTL